MSPDDLSQVLRWCMLKIGIRAQNLPTPEEGVILFEHLVRHYGNHSPEEIKQAFDLAITGQLDVDATTYESFDCRYISRILNAYRIWGQATYNQYQHVLELPAAKVYEDRSWREEAQKELDKFYQGCFKHRLVLSEIHDQLVVDGFINAFGYESFIEQARMRLLHKIQVEIASIKNEWTDENVDAGKYKSVQTLEQRLVDYRSGRLEYEIKLLAKQLTVAHYFAYLNTQDIKTIYQKD